MGAHASHRLTVEPSSGSVPTLGVTEAKKRAPARLFFHRPNDLLFVLVVILPVIAADTVCDGANCVNNCAALSIHIDVLLICDKCPRREIENHTMW